jgi:hypothetical protein
MPVTRTRRRAANLTVTAALSLASGLACGPPRFVEPKASDPHAVVKIRVVYHARPGPSLRETITLDTFQVAQGSAERQIEYPFTRALRVPPRPTRWGVNATFYHSESRQVQVQVAERYACGTYQSGSGPYATTITNYCTRYRTETRTQSVPVDDAVCNESLNQVVRAGAAYLVQYDFYDEGKCTLTCSEQTNVGGNVALSPCAEPAGETK